MKTKPQRSDLLVVGAGLAGICAAVSAARSGLMVHFIEKTSYFGGRLSPISRTKYDSRNMTNFPYCRESGLLDEILAFVFKNNPEGSHLGLSRALRWFISHEQRIKIFTDQSVSEARLNEAEDRIVSILSFCESTGERILFRAPYFIDCTGSGILARLAGTTGEHVPGQECKDANDLSPNVRVEKSAVVLRVEETGSVIPFRCPEWIKIRWEQNAVSARLEWMKSLKTSLTGYHYLEWLSQDTIHQSSSPEEVAWAAWDFLKNRSPIKEIAQSLSLVEISPIPHLKNSFRGFGEYFLSFEDVTNGTTFEDSVAVCRAPLSSDQSLLFSDAGKIVPPQPFEIPLRTLISKEIKNLLWAGEHASCSAQVSPCFSHPPTAAQLGEAAGICVAESLEKKRLPRTLAKDGHIQSLHSRLESVNHSTRLSVQDDPGNLTVLSSATASSTLKSFSDRDSLGSCWGPNTQTALLQFPIHSDVLDGIRIFIECQESALLQYKLLQGSGHQQSIPGNCIETGEISLDNSSAFWVSLPFDCDIQSPGWHFLELRSSTSFRIGEQVSPPVGVLSQYPRKLLSTTGNNPYNNYTTHYPADCSLARGPQLEVFPTQNVYSARETSQSPRKPTNLPNLWISEATNFKYPEFIELKWKTPVEISTICIDFDPSYENIWDSYPTPFKNHPMPALIKSYRIYGTNESGKSFLLAENNHNFIPTVRHDFEETSVISLEIEVISTHGANRAQIYKVRAYS